MAILKFHHILSVDKYLGWQLARSVLHTKRIEVMKLYRTTLDQLLVWLKDSYIGDQAPSIDVLAGGSH